ncbi:T9SS type A sorting domain-containing protein [Pseudotamlana agarivorans]|uniref:T9SS type A sorting domain-containing protein n=1 Tax=Pseudotamlana agarivorans TaxID=481183 RepID=UPI00082B804A|nr:T9SS type A sorting domain-containing protein [Tamlana agarivorans]
MKKLKYILFSLAVFLTFTNLLVAQETKYKLEYKINNESSSGHFKIYFDSKEVYSSNKQETTTFEGVITMPDPISEVRFTESCTNGTDEYILPLRQSYNLADIFSSPNNCFGYINEEYFRIAELVKVTPNSQPLKTIYTCEPFTIEPYICDYSQTSAFCSTFKSAIEYEFQDSQTNNITKSGDIPYSPGSTYNLSDIPDLDASDNTVTLRIRYTEDKIINAVRSGEFIVDVIGCSPKLVDHKKTDETCFNANDGTITLTFEHDVDKANGWEMRYFIYEGDPDIFPQGKLKDIEQPDIEDIQTLDDPFIVLNSNFEGTYSGLGPGTYFIVYQEVKYDRDPSNGTDPTVVKSGAITDPFEINPVSEVILDINKINFTDAKCGNSAVFNVNNSASGGNDFITDGTYSYEYSEDNGSNWTTVNGGTNTFEIAPQSTTQMIQVRGVYNYNTYSTCAGKIETFTISAAVDPILITNSSTGTSSTENTENGNARVEFTGGSTIYTYELVKLNINTNNFEVITKNYTETIDIRSVTYNSLSPGTYRIIITDENDCKQESTDLVVGIDPKPNIGTPVVSEIKCIGAKGSISFPITDFAGNYNYQWIFKDSENEMIIDRGVSDFNELVLSDLDKSGTYILRVGSERLSVDDFKDPKNYNQASFTLTPPVEVKIVNVTPINTSCNGSNDGKISLELSGGNNYEYAIANSPVDETVWQTLTDNTIDNLQPGYHYLTIRNENGCESEIWSNPIFIKDSETISISEVINSHKDVSQNGGSDGAIELNVSNGTGPYNFEWTGPNLYTSDKQNPEGLKAGDYSVTVTDSNGCTKTFGPITIKEPGPLNIDKLNVTHVSCKGSSTGEIIAEITGSAPYTYVWSKTNAPDFSAPNQAQITNLSPGTYTLTLTDNSGATVTSSVVISEPDEALSATAIGLAPSCINNKDGEITITATGGTPPYLYSVNAGLEKLTTNTFTSLEAKSYTVTVYDANNCEVTLNNIRVPEATKMTIDATKLNVSEAGETDGAIFTTVSGGVAPYTYSWKGPNLNNVSTNDITNLTQGLYTLTVKDANGCEVSQTFNITEPEKLNVTATQSLSIICNGDLAEITAKVTGGVPNYTYNWYQVGVTVPLTDDDGKQEILSNIKPGSYYVTITDANLISINSEIIEITEPEVLKAELTSKTDIICEGVTSGSINIAVTGGTPPYTFYWNDEISTQNISNLPSGAYTFYVIDKNGCYSSDIDVTIENPINPLHIQDVEITNISEYSANDGSINLTVSGGKPKYEYEWTRLSDGNIFSNQPTVINLSPGIYQVNITDANACTITQEYNITQPDIIEENITNPTCNGSADGSISLLVNKGDGTFSYLWNTGATTSRIDNLEAGEYVVEVTGFDEPLTRTYVIENPLPLKLDLGANRVLCKDQSIEIDAELDSIEATYLWTSDNGFSSTNPNVNLSEKGNYTLTINTSTGCSVSDTVFVDVSDDEINAELAVSSQVYVDEILIVVDISFPFPENIEWILPNEAKILKQNNDEVEMVFNTPGEYEVGIITTKGNCTEIQTKKILVLSKDPTVEGKDTNGGRKLIEDFIVYPNPSDGKFTAKVSLSEKGNISIKIFNFINNMLVANEKSRGEIEYKIPFDISHMPTGVYAVLLETPYGSTLRKIIIK